MSEALHPPTCAKCNGLCCQLFVFSGPKLTSQEWNQLEPVIEQVCESGACRNESELHKCRSLKALPLKGARVPYSCAFLSEEGRCNIYEVRPQACRQYPLQIVSTSKEVVVRISEDCYGGVELYRRAKDTPESFVLPAELKNRTLSVELTSFYEASVSRLE